MRLSFIITIDPIKDVSILNVLIHSLNLQTNKSFDVIFYNQTLMTEPEIFGKLCVKPGFDYSIYHVDRRLFFGKFPLWDLYALHSMLIDQNALNPYFMSLHSEEFLDANYVENAIKVLETNEFDIMFGNLSRTQLTYKDITPILDCLTPQDFDRYLHSHGIKNAPHWAFNSKGLFYSMNPNVLRRNAKKLLHFKLKQSLTRTTTGYTKLPSYIAEDVYFMKVEFAKRYNWFLRGHHMYFEDIHICERKQVCELSKELEIRTEFPIYFNQSKVYHIEHEKYYFQLLDEEFTSLILNYQTDDTGLKTLQHAITMYKNGTLGVKEALAYTRHNANGTGSQNLNYKYHMKYLRNGTNLERQASPLMENGQQSA